MAHIIQFPNCAPEPVQQRRGPGRYPKSIVSLYQRRMDKSLAHCAPINPVQPVHQMSAVEAARDYVRTVESILHKAQYELSIAQQQAEGKRL
jgi:hypothetical protein